MIFLAALFYCPRPAPAKAAGTEACGLRPKHIELVIFSPKKIKLCLRLVSKALRKTGALGRPQTKKKKIAC
ncbi:MAG: hypothetical protein D6714_13555 [Bacteroidetes bacterium]|nr:MAG: hypothetical protein D6714_13555 [Bacteroidota bacterium]